MKSEILVPGVIHLQGVTQYDISSMFMRLQEFYESACGLQNKYFELEELMDAYATNEHSHNFTYTTDWAGFNVPGNIVDKFRKTYNGYMTVKEELLFDLLDGHLAEEDGRYKNKYYLIGTYAECLEVSYYVYHEMCHALWYMYSDFKTASRKLVRSLPKSDYTILREKLIEDGYHSKVIDDEINAYLSTSSMSDIINMFEQSDRAIPWENIAQMQQNFYEYHDSVTLLST